MYTRENTIEFWQLLDSIMGKAERKFGCWAGPKLITYYQLPSGEVWRLIEEHGENPVSLEKIS